MKGGDVFCALCGMCCGVGVFGGCGGVWVWEWGWKAYNRQVPDVVYRCQVQVL